MQKHKQALILLLMLFATFSAASYSITGRTMIDDVPIDEILIKVSDDTGEELASTYSNSKGAFIIRNLVTQRIVLEASGKGYTPVRLSIVADNNDINIGILNLEKVTDIKEVTVSAQRGKFVAPDKTIVYADKADKQRAATPLNMLTLLAYKAPQIHVKESEQTITIDGEDPEILVNGIKRSLSFITSLNQGNIEKIEFSNMPDARYGKRYLNIITRRNEEGGWLMADLTGAITTPRYFLNGAAEYTSGKNDFLLYYSGGYRNGKKEYENTLEKYWGDGKEITLSSEGKPSSTLDKYHNISFYYTRSVSDRRMLAATASLNYHNNERTVLDRVIGMDKEYNRDNNRGYRLLRPNLSIYYYLQPSSTAVIEINGVGSYNNYTSHRDLAYSSGFHSELSTASRTWYFSAEAIWKQNLKFAGLNTGIVMRFNNASNEYLINGTHTNQNLTSRNIRAYTSLNGTLLSIGYYLSAGVTYFKVERAITTPDINLSLKKFLGNNFSISYYFSYNPTSPSVSSYNNIIVPVNDIMYRIEDGNLKSQQNLTNQIQLQYNRNKFFLSLQSSAINISRPFVIDYSYQNNPRNPLYGFFIEKTCNGKSFRSYGADFNGGVSNLWNFLSFSVSMGWGHRRITSSNRFTVASWYLGLNLGLYWKGWQLNFTGDDLVPSWTMWGSNQKIKRWPYTSLAVYKKFGKWNLRAAWSNIFSTCGGRYHTEIMSTVAPHWSEYRMNDQGNLLEIAVRYQFVTGKLMNKKKRTINLSGDGEHGILWDY